MVTRIPIPADRVLDKLRELFPNEMEIAALTVELEITQDNLRAALSSEVDVGDKPVDLTPEVAKRMLGEKAVTESSAEERSGNGHDSGRDTPHRKEGG